MPPLTLEGRHLGEIHKSFNSKVKEVVVNKTPFAEIKAKYGDADLDQLLKIDVACNYRDVDYIIEVLKSEDMLHISKAIKGSAWLVTDEQYAHIMNPHHLNSELFPHMTSKAICKLLHHIRLHLRDESRIDEFYRYYEQIDIDKALKWLPNCSVDVIEGAVDVHSLKIKPAMFKRLCQRTYKIINKIEAYPFHLKKQYLEAVKFLLNTHTTVYLDIVEKTFIHHSVVKFGKKHTGIIMAKCPERILNNFQKYAHFVDLQEVGKHLGSSNIKEFILEQSKNNVPFFFEYKNVKPLIKLMPKEGKFDFLKEFFINKGYNNNLGGVNVVPATCSFGGSSQFAVKRKSGTSRPSSNENIYQWYRHAPFDIAFPDLKKLIKTESSPEERGAIMRVVLTAAGQNMNHIQTILQYYHDKHINEPFKYKINLINAIISTTHTHKYDKKTWEVLEEIFHNMEVYIQSDNNVQNCVEAIIIYKSLHDEPIPVIVEEKFEFNTLKKTQSKLNDNEKEKVFKYLYSYIERKLDVQTLVDKDGFHETVSLIEKAFNLLSDWNKELNNYPKLLEKIREIIKFKHDRKMDIQLERFYYKKKSWSKYMFEESLLLSPCQKVCLNALKHDPELLQRYAAEVEDMRCDDSVVLKQLHTKLKVYWASSLGEDWTNAYRNQMKQTKANKALTRGLCVLLPRNELLGLLDQYAPDTSKIAWSEIDENLLSLRKHFGRLMYCARPQPPPASILKYARGDYLQYALPSLLSIFSNMSSYKSRGHLPELLDSAVSLKKHGIRFAISKLNVEELKQMMSTIWSTTRNASIKAVIFKEAFDMMCRENKPNKIDDLWRLLEHFIDRLSTDENKSIYILLGDINKIPRVVQGKFCVKSYKLLNSLPAKANCEKLVEQMVLYTANIMDLIDPDFVAEVISDFIDVWLVKKKILNKRHHSQYPGNMLNVISAYLLTTPDESEQNKRYNKVFIKMLNNLLELWKEEIHNEKVSQRYFEQCIDRFIYYLKKNIVAKAPLPEKLFCDIVNELEDKLPIEENYHIITYCKLIVLYIQCCKMCKPKFEITEDEIESGDKYHTMHDTFIEMQCNKKHEDFVWPMTRTLFAKESVKLLKQDVEKYFPSIQILFKNALNQFHSTICQSRGKDFVFVKALIDDNDYVPAYLTAIDMIIMVHSFDDQTKKDKKEVQNIIDSHPSIEVRMHSFKRFAF